MNAMRVLIWILLVAFPSLAPAEHKPLNFVHVIIDDLRSEGLPLYSNEGVILAPNLERLASEGVLFENAYANFPSCGASRASMFSGLRPTVNRFTRYDARLDKDAPDTVILPEYLKQNGYLTMSLGKVIHAQGDSDHAWSVAPWDAKYHDKNTTSYMDFKNPENIEAYKTSCKKKGICSPSGSGKGPPYEIEDLSDDVYIDGKTAIAAIAALEDLKLAGQPFYLAVGFVKPHLPFTAPKKYWDMYERGNLKMSAAPDKPDGAPRQAWHHSGELREWYSGIPDIPPAWDQNVPDELSRILRHGYYASATYSDGQLGKVLDAIERLQLEDNTVVILSSDHGFSLGDHTLWNKHSLFSLATKSPLIIRVPEVEPNKRVSGLVEYVDIYPTVAELANLPRPRHLQGKSLVSNLRDPNAPTKSAVFVRYKDGENIHTGQFSYTAWFNKHLFVSDMLYDLDSDPLETRNVVNDMKYRIVAKDLRKQLIRHIKKREAAAR